jgi:3-oxoacyl-(acyl-carrier-protein) synthase
VSALAKLEGFAIPEGFSTSVGAIGALAARTLASGECWNALDRSAQLGLAASLEAATAAKLAQVSDRARVGVCISTAIGQIGAMEDSFRRQSGEATRPLAPVSDGDDDRDWRSFHFNSTAATIAKELDCQGGCVTVTTGCTGGLDALGYALDAIRAGEDDVAISGAAEAPITPLVVAAFGKIGATSLRNDDPSHASRPFDTQRDGFVLGEGAAMLVLEELEHARARGAMILAEIAGYGTVNNCHHMTDIPADGARIARSAELALADAGIAADAIDFINAHGSSTPQNDVAEANAFERVFGERSSRIPVTSIKSQIGHPLAASNSIEVVASVLTLLHGEIPPTINLVEIDPRCDLDVVGNVARSAVVRSILKTSSGFSGIHSALVIRAWQEN